MYDFVLIGGYGMFRSRYGGLDFVFKFTVQRVLFVIFFKEFERIVEFVFTYRNSRWFFGLGEGNFPSEFQFFFFDMTRWSVISPAVFREIYTKRSSGSTGTAFFRLVSLVPGHVQSVFRTVPSWFRSVW